jgi:hypothetical protein
MRTDGSACYTFDAKRLLRAGKGSAMDTGDPGNSQPTSNKMPGGLRKGVVLFVHGLGGHETETWGQFPAFLRQNSELTAQYDLDDRFLESGGA